MLLLCLFVLGITVVDCVQSNVSPGTLENLEEKDECSRIYLSCSNPKQHSGDYVRFLYHPHDLDIMCRENMKFRLCLDSAYEECASLESVSSFTEKITRNRQFLEELCAPGSLWAALYLKSSPCINKHLPDIARRCSVTDDITKKEMLSVSRLCTSRYSELDCKMNSIATFCGIEAADIYQRIIAINGELDACCHPFSSELGSIVPGSTREVFMERLTKHHNLVTNYVKQSLNSDVNDNFSEFESCPSFSNSNNILPGSTKEYLNPVSQEPTSEFVLLKPDQFRDTDGEKSTAETTISYIPNHVDQTIGYDPYDTIPSALMAWTPIEFPAWEPVPEDELETDTSTERGSLNPINQEVTSQFVLQEDQFSDTDTEKGTAETTNFYIPNHVDQTIDYSTSDEIPSALPILTTIESTITDHVPENELETDESTEQGINYILRESVTNEIPCSKETLLENIYSEDEQLKVHFVSNTHQNEGVSNSLGTSDLIKENAIEDIHRQGEFEPNRTQMVEQVFDDTIATLKEFPRFSLSAVHTPRLPVPYSFAVNFLLAGNGDVYLEDGTPLREAQKLLLLDIKKQEKEILQIFENEELGETVSETSTDGFREDIFNKERELEKEQVEYPHVHYANEPYYDLVPDGIFVGQNPPVPAEKELVEYPVHREPNYANEPYYELVPDGIFVGQNPPVPAVYKITAYMGIDHNVYLRNGMLIDQLIIDLEEQEAKIGIHKPNPSDFLKRHLITHGRNVIKSCKLTPYRKYTADLNVDVRNKKQHCAIRRHGEARYCVNDSSKNPKSASTIAANKELESRMEQMKLFDVEQKKYFEKYDSTFPDSCKDLESLGDGPDDTLQPEPRNNEPVRKRPRYYSI